jgi:hypothetical protein
MSDYRDPNQLPDPSELRRRAQAEGYGATWGWIAGAVFIVLVLAVIYGASGDGTPTATQRTTSPATTTGQAPRPGMPAAPARPGPATTGQGQQ